MNCHCLRHFGLICTIALTMSTYLHPSTGRAQPNPQGQVRSTEAIELPGQTLKFQPTRDDITVGCAIVSLHHSNLRKALPLQSIRVNGKQPKTPVLYLKQVGKNQFEFPAAKIEFSSQALEGPLYVTVKVWFKQVTNQYDSPYYVHTPDRYALVSYCTREDDDPSKVNARLSANRVASLEEFVERLGEPFVIQLNQQPLREEWGRWPMVNNRRLSDADVKLIEQLLSERGERYLIAVSGSRQDRATVHVGDGDLFESKRRYELKRSDGMWQIDRVKDLDSGW